MSILTDLRAALDERTRLVEQAAQLPISEIQWQEAQVALWDANRAWKAALTDDTIRALLDVAEAAEHEPRCPFCAEERHMAGWPTQPHLSDCPLAPLVKEADDDTTRQAHRDDEGGDAWSPHEMFRHQR